MTDALMGLARQGGTAHPVLSRIILARNVNMALGGALVGPWDVDDLDDVTLDAIQGLVVDLADYRAGQNEVEDIFRKWRAEHPTYGK